MADNGETGQAQARLSKVFGSYKAEWLKNDIFRLFTQPNYFVELEGTRPCVLEGGRGTGKTTVLRGLSYEGQFYQRGPDIKKQDYIGLYYRVNTNRVSAFAGPELSEERWSKVFAHYFNLLGCQLIVNFLAWYEEHLKTKVVLPADTEAILCGALYLKHCSNLASLGDSLEKGLADFEAYVNNVGDGKQVYLSLQGSPIDLFTKRVLSTKEFAGKQFFYLIDEYENLLDNQQRVINTLIKHSSEFYSFKIGVRELGWRQKTTLNSNERLVSPADYSLVEIAKKLKDKVFDNFAASIVNKRIADLRADAPNMILDIRTALVSLTAEEEARLLGIDGRVMRMREEIGAVAETSEEKEFASALSDLQVYFITKKAEADKKSVQSLLRQFAQDPHVFNTSFDNYKYAILFTIKAGKRGIRKYCAGWSAFLRMGSSNIRYLLELVEQTYITHLFKENSLASPIDAETQTLTAQRVGQKNLTELEGLSTEGGNLVRLVLSLGRIFQVMARNPFGHTPEVNQFFLKLEGGHCSDEVERLLKQAVMHLALIRSPGNKLMAPEQIQESDYMLHPIFSAFFDYSNRRKRKIQLTESDITQLTKNPKAGIRKVLEANNRELNPDDLPEQLSLFEAFYAE